MENYWDVRSGASCVGLISLLCHANTLGCTCRCYILVFKKKHSPFLMQADHLPDETCDICGGKFRPRAFRQHWETCTGSAPCRSRAAQYKKLLRFWVEDLEGSKKNRRKGRCLLCPARDQLVCHQAFVQHMQVIIFSH